MYKPDRGIVKKIKLYDSYLYVKWNERQEFFEVWREMGWGHRLITPVTLSIYFQNAPKHFVELDERIIWWLKEADAWSHTDGIKGHSMEGDRRWKEWHLNIRKAKIREYRDMAKDGYSLITNFYSKKYASRNGKPKFNNYKPQRWIRPDSQSLVNPRVFGRTYTNAKAFNYKKR